MYWPTFSVHIVLAALICLISPSLCFPSRQRAQLCNGSPDLCTFRYSAVKSVFGAHDSPFVGPLPQQNQNVATSAQLDRGVRMLQAQTHRSPDDPNALKLCHTDCRLEDAGLLKDWLAEIRTWMEAKGHENEVVTLLLTNPDGMPIQAFGDAFQQSGAESLCFTPGPGEAEPLKLDSWPTLGVLIGSGKRLIVFIDSGANPKTNPYILPEFSYFFETPFDVTDSNFPSCSIDRPSGASADGRMYIINHFLDREIAPGIKVPDRLRASRTNSKESIGRQVERCRALYGGDGTPNFVLMDFVEVGDWSGGGGGGVKGKGKGDVVGEAGSVACDLLRQIGIDC